MNNSEESDLDLTKRQAQIIEASFQIIEEAGPSAFTIREIADTIGLSEGAIYRHFKSKEEILLAMLRFFRDKNKKHLEELIKRDDLSTMECIRQLFEKFRDSKCSHHKSGSATSFHQMFSDIPDIHSRIFNIMQPLRDRILFLIKRGQARGELNIEMHAESLTIMLISLFKGMEFFIEIADKSHETLGNKKELSENIWKNMMIMLTP